MGTIMAGLRKGIWGFFIFYVCFAPPEPLEGGGGGLVKTGWADFQPPTE